MAYGINDTTDTGWNQKKETKWIIQSSAHSFNSAITSSQLSAFYISLAWFSLKKIKTKKNWIQKRKKYIDTKITLHQLHETSAVQQQISRSVTH